MKAQIYARKKGQIRVAAFNLVLQDGARPSIDTDFECLRSDLDVEGIAQATSARFLFEFLIGNFAVNRFECGGARLFDRHLRAGSQLFARVGCGAKGAPARAAAIAAAKGACNFIIILSLPGPDCTQRQSARARCRDAAIR